MTGEDNLTTNTQLNEAGLNFLYLPAYAKFLLDNKLDELVTEQSRLAKEINIPLLKFFKNLSEEQQVIIGKQSIREMLDCIAENKSTEYIEMSRQRWAGNQLPVITNNQISAEDITYISYVRRKLFRKFIPSYTSNIELIIAIANEVDLFTVTIDTTSFKQLINIQQQLYKEAQALAHIGNWRWDLANKKLTWSDELYNIYELELQSEITNEKIAAYNHPDDVKSINNYMQTSKDALVPHDFYYRIILNNGKEKFLHAKGEVKQDNNGKPIELYGTLQDVTKQKQNEKQLEESKRFIEQQEKKYHLMINEVEDYAILLLDNDGYIQNWNKGAEKIKGYKEDEIVGKHFRIFYRQEDRDRKLPDTLIERAKNEGKASHEGWRVRKDGTVFWGSVVITALHDEQNNLKGFSKVTRNLTERKLAEDQLKEHAGNMEKHNEELIRINKELDSFTYMASHDLQEPLRKIKTFCDRILNKELKALSPEGISYFNKITMAADRMQRLIEDLLDYSRTSTSEIKFEPTDINNMIDDIKQELAEQIAKKKGSVQSSHLPIVNVIPVQFRQLFFNIIENAVKYSRENVPLHVSISHRFLTHEHVDDDKPEMIEFCISDNGIGFEKQYEEKIFKLFHRLHGRQEYPGTGVGLAICKKIVDNHEGTITATSEPGKGSTFIITIPVH